MPTAHLAHSPSITQIVVHSTQRLKTKTQFCLLSGQVYLERTFSSFPRLLPFHRRSSTQMLALNCMDCVCLSAAFVDQVCVRVCLLWMLFCFPFVCVSSRLTLFRRWISTPDRPSLCVSDALLFERAFRRCLCYKHFLKLSYKIE